MLKISDLIENHPYKLLQIRVITKEDRKFVIAELTDNDGDFQVFLPNNYAKIFKQKYTTFNKTVLIRVNKNEVKLKGK